MPVCIQPTPTDDKLKIFADKPEGKKLKIHQLTTAISAAWQKLTDEEKKSYTSERVEQITQDHEEQANAPRNTALRAFHDASQNLQSIQGEVSFATVCIHVELTSPVS